MSTPSVTGDFHDISVVPVPGPIPISMRTLTSEHPLNDAQAAITPGNQSTLRSSKLALTESFLT